MLLWAAIETGAAFASVNPLRPRHEGSTMNSHPRQGAFQPEELDALQSIYDEITAQSWFPDLPEAREDLAKYLFETFPSPTYDADRHRSDIEASVRLYYANECAH